jgi:hypothetical protein
VWPRSRTRLGVSFGAFTDNSGIKRIWYEETPFHRKFVQGTTWSSVWAKAWGQWVSHLPEMNSKFLNQKYVLTVDEDDCVKDLVSAKLLQEVSRLNVPASSYSQL